MNYEQSIKYAFTGIDGVVRGSLFCRPAPDPLEGFSNLTEAIKAGEPAWWKDDSDRAYIEAFNQAWRGKDGWALWVEGEIPLRRKTADQLEVGTYFLGKAWGDDPYLAYVGRPLEIDTVKTIYYAPGMLKAITPASEWVVLEEYGPFQKPEGK